MPEDIEKRLTAVERGQDKLVNALEQISTTLKKFESHIDELFDLKSKIDSIDVIWRKIDDITNKCNAVELAFKLLQAEHHTCKPVVDSIAACKMDFDHRLKTLENASANSSAFTSKLIGTLLEKVIWAIVVGGALSAVYLAGKGVFAK